MKKLLTIVVAALVFTGCSTKYETIDHKDVSVRVRSFWVDCDYDSRVVKNPELPYPMESLEYLPGAATRPLEPLKE